MYEIMFYLEKVGVYKKRTIRVGQKISGQIVDSTSLNSEK